MSQRIRPELREHDAVVVGPALDTSAMALEAATGQGVITSLTPAVDRSRLGLVLTGTGAGLLMQGAGDALARSGHASPALALFFCGIALQFAVSAWRLTSRQAARQERIVVSLVLGLGLLASYLMLEPLLLDSFDELAHLGTLVRILDSHSVFPTNTILPVSPYYPGLELATAATKWLTGLPLIVDQQIVLAAVRLVLILGIFLVVERACHSSRAGGVGVLVYAASPQFYAFDAQYAYETIALAFAVAVVYFLFVSIDVQRPKFGAAFALALGSIGAVVISHHVAGWLTVSFLVVWFAGLYLLSHPVDSLTMSRWRLRFLTPARPSVPPEPLSRPEGQPSVQSASASGPEQLRARRWKQARVVGVAAGVGVVVGAAWTVFVGRLLTRYLGPVFSAAAAEISAALGNAHGNRTLFKSAAGGGSPPWEIALILLAAASWCALLLPALYSVVFKRTVRGGAFRYIPVVIAATYPLSVLANVSSASKIVADRATTFIFFGMAVVVGAWLAVRISKNRRTLERVATIGLATIVFVGSLLFGIGPLVSLLPGPYRVGADSLSYGAPSLALAHWADTNLPAGSHVAADRDNSVLLNAIGGVDAVTPQGGLVNPELLYFDHRLTPYDISLIRKADIRYIVVDDRLARGLPLYGTYIASGEPSKRLTLAQLNKFDSYPFAKRIYDNGPIKVYDVTALLPASARAAPAGPSAGGSGLNVGIFILAAAVAVVWLLRIRGRRRPMHDIAHLVMCAVTGALLVGVFGAFLIRLMHVPPEAAAIIVLLVLLVLGLRRPTSRLRDGAFFRRFSTEGMGTSRLAPSRGGAPDLDPAFYKRREVKIVLAYIKVLTDPDDETSTRRILNVPARGIGRSSVSLLVTWAEDNNVSLCEAIDHAEEAGLQNKSLEGAVQLSASLAELRPLVETTEPQELVRLVADRTGYLDDLIAKNGGETHPRVRNLTELAARASQFDDTGNFLETVLPVTEFDTLDSRDPVASPPVVDRPDPTPSPSTPDPVRRSRTQLLLGCLGVALFALGATLATVAALKDWTPPPELSVSTAATGRSVAQVQLGSAGPVAASLEVRRDGRTVWGSRLTRTTGVQTINLPRHVGTGSRVVLTSGGRTLRRVDG